MKSFAERCDLLQHYYKNKGICLQFYSIIIAEGAVRGKRDRSSLPKTAEKPAARRKIPRRKYHRQGRPLPASALRGAFPTGRAFYFSFRAGDFFRNAMQNFFDGGRPADRYAAAFCNIIKDRVEKGRRGIYKCPAA